MNVVSIMAHQDDEMRCLGTMLKCKKRGDMLSFITLTDGSKGFVQNPTISRSNAAKIRHNEMSALANKIGVQYTSLDEQDEFLYDTPDVRMRLIEAIRATKADLIFTHFTEDYNLDHSTTSSLVLHCAMQAALPVLPTASPSLKKTPAIFLTPPHGSFAFTATHFVDISEFEEDKIQLLLCHDSQEKAMLQSVGAGFEKLCNRPDAYWGELAGCTFAEAFTPLKSRGTIKPYNVLP